jgi:predicted secreted protein
MLLRNYMNKIVYVLISLIIFVGCFTNKEDVVTQTQAEYSNFIDGYTRISFNSVNTMKVGETFFVMFETSSILYNWHYSLQNKSIQFIDMSSFDYNPEGIVGGSVSVVWRFKIISSGITAITYDLKSITNSSDIIESHVFNITVN